jgi:hypothetical protein
MSNLPQAGAGLGLPPEVNQFSAYQTTKTPRGYETAHSYFSQHNPEAFWLLPDAVQEVYADLGPLTVMTLEKGREVIVVDAPSALQERGVHKTLAFPEVILRRFYR